jgi:hypothetical protein
MPAVNEHNHSVRDLWLRLLCDSHTMSKVHTLGTISSILTGSTEWNMLFSDTRNIPLQAYSDWGRKENRNCSQKQTNSLYVYVSQISLKKL